MGAQSPIDAEPLAGQEAFDFGPPRPLVRGLRDGERRSVLEVIGRAFEDDPVAIHLFPRARDRAARWARFSGLAIDLMGDTAHVDTTDGIRGGAIWQLPTDENLGWTRRVGVALRFVFLLGTGAPRAIRLGDDTGAHRPTEPHYYLAALGTDPRFQRQGVGAALLQPVLERCDREGLPAYLESSKERNVPFYQKHGFEVVEELTIPGGPRVWPMRRAPSQPRRR